MAAASDRNDLVRLARALETLAGQGGVDFERLLADFNERTRATCTRSTFAFLHQAEKAEELVDRLLEIRDAEVFVAPRSAEDVTAYVARARKTDRYVDQDYAGRALAHLSGLPTELAHQLGSGFGWLPCWPPDDEIIPFALAYRPLASKEELYAFVRRWLEDEADRRCSVYAAVGEALLRERQSVLRVPELERIVVNLATGVDIRRTHALAQLRKCVGIGSRRSEGESSAQVDGEPLETQERVHHAKFGDGVVVRRDGSGLEAKVTVRFESGDKTMLGTFSDHDVIAVPQP